MLVKMLEVLQPQIPDLPELGIPLAPSGLSDADLLVLGCREAALSDVLLTGSEERSLVKDFQHGDTETRREAGKRMLAGCVGLMMRAYGPSEQTVHKLQFGRRPVEARQHKAA